MKPLRVLRNVLVLIGSVLFAWLVLAKVLTRLAAQLGLHLPCPASLGWAIDNVLRRWHVRPILRRLHIHRGETVLELGCGPGVFTVDAAREVGREGRLIAVDLQPKMIARTEERVAEARLTNVETHVADAADLPLEDESVDRAFLVSVLHEIANPAAALDELNRVLKPGGLLSVSEDFMDPDYAFPFETVQRVEAMGFSREQFFGNFWLYTMTFCKDEGITYD